MSARELIKQYCADPRKQIQHPGETVPTQNTIDKMENHRTTAFIDGISYFSDIRDEIQNLITSIATDRFFYLTAWWLGLSAHSGALRIDNTWNYDDADFDEFVLPRPPNTLRRRLKMMADSGVAVRVLPWVLPFVTIERIEGATGMGDINFHTLVSVSELRHDLGADSVVLNLMAHTFGGAHCKMVVCGDQNSMRAYTSGLGPVFKRLHPPGFSKAKVTNRRSANTRQLVRRTESTDVTIQTNVSRSTTGSETSIRIGRCRTVRAW